MRPSVSTGTPGLASRVPSLRRSGHRQTSPLDLLLADLRDIEDRLS